MLKESTGSTVKYWITLSKPNLCVFSLINFFKFRQIDESTITLFFVKGGGGRSRLFP